MLDIVQFLQYNDDNSSFKDEIKGHSWFKVQNKSEEVDTEVANKSLLSFCKWEGMYV